MGGPRRVPTGHLDALDGLRTVAIALVVGVHVVGPTGMLNDPGIGWRMLAAGGVGVPIFFVLSGYLLYRPYARATLDGTPLPGTRDFLRRRALRILPAYWLMLPFALVLLNREHAADPVLWLQMITLTQNYDPNPPWDLTALGLPGLVPIWSLSVEAAFYLLLPLFALGLHRFARGSRRRLLGGIGALFALSLVEALGLRFVEYTGPVFGYDPIAVLFYNERLLPRSLLYFALGMALAVLAERPGRLSEAVGRAPGIGWTVAVSALALLSTPLATPLFGGDQTARQYVVFSLLTVVVAAAAVAPAALAPDHPFTRGLLANPVMRRIGLVSYGVFLWHAVVIEGWYALTGRDHFAFDFWLVLSVTVLFSLVLASLSLVLVEQPAQRLARHLQSRARRNPPREEPAPRPVSAGN
ncbi:acyltransferase [Actinocorallia sp. API 0066]|uniref:acyltransferase family protein n=1 Tax=Actinocorallia sp. API 0066 TaxID=2896846 RepID=UPI0027153CDA|nr:acyltransferase [Actinocorallia sp. API 0066]